MPLSRDEDGVWRARLEGAEDENISAVMAEAMPRYLTILDSLFDKSRSTNELEFLFSLFRPRAGYETVGWDPYQATLYSIPPLFEALPDLNPEVADHLSLWIYGHIVEASEPYELLANLLEVARGSHYAWNTNFPPKGRRHQSPGEKIQKINGLAAEAEIPNVSTLLSEVWDRDLRNAVFHSDYVIYAGEVRLRDSRLAYSADEVCRFVDRAAAYHFALANMRKVYVEDYTEPKTIPNSVHYEGDPELQWRTIIREGYGVAGVKEIWTSEQIRAGKIPQYVGQFFEDESRLLRNDHALDRLPARPETTIHWK